MLLVLASTLSNVKRMKSSKRRGLGVSCVDEHCKLSFESPVTFLFKTQYAL